MLIVARLHFGLHAKYCSLEWKYLKIMHADNTACCMTPMLLAAYASDCTPHAPNLFLMKPPKLLQV